MKTANKKLIKAIKILYELTTEIVDDIGGNLPIQWPSPKEMAKEPGKLEYPVSQIKDFIRDLKRDLGNIKKVGKLKSLEELEDYIDEKIKDISDDLGELEYKTILKYEINEMIESAIKNALKNKIEEAKS